MPNFVYGGWVAPLYNKRNLDYYSCANHPQWLTSSVYSTDVAQPEKGRKEVLELPCIYESKAGGAGGAIVNYERDAIK